MTGGSSEHRHSPGDPDPAKTLIGGRPPTEPVACPEPSEQMKCHTSWHPPGSVAPRRRSDPVKQDVVSDIECPPPGTAGPVTQRAPLDIAG